MTTQPLSALVADARAHAGLSLRQVAEASGGLLSKTHVAAIERGDTVRVTDRTLAGLAMALGLSAAKLRAAAGLSSRVLPPFEVPSRANRLSLRERKVVLAVIDALLAAHER